MAEKGDAGFLADTRSVAKSSVLAAAKATGKASALCRDRVRAVWKEAASMAARASERVVSSASPFHLFENGAKPAKPAKPREEQPQKPRVPANASAAEEAGPEASDLSGKATAESSLEAADTGMPPPREDPTAKRESLQAELEFLAKERTGAMATIRELEQEVARLTEHTRALEEDLAERKATLAGIRKVTATFATRKGAPQEECPPRQEREKERPASGAAPVGGIDGTGSQVGEAAGTDEGAIADVEAPEAPPAATESGTPSGGVTPGEVEAATFATAAEKVMFRQALSDMESADEATRMEAARMLAGIRHELTVRAIAGWFAREPAAGVRKECVKALTRLGLEEVLPEVERALADAAASVRLAAVHATYRLAGPGGAATLVPILRDENEDVRRRAAICIGWLGEKRLAGDLLPLLADRSAAVRSAALEAMGNLRSRQVVTRVIELLDDPEESVRREAFGVLGAITGKRIANTLPEDGDSRQRLIARWRARWEKESRIAGSQRPLEIAFGE